jgi:signal transduction histidine kinase
LRLAKAIELERLRVRIASDLHDDIGASLTKISLYADLIQNDADTATTKDLLRKIGTLSRELVTTMIDVVWSIDARNDTMGNLIDRMRDFAAGVFSVQSIDVVFYLTGLDMHKKLPINFRQNLYLIFKEAINNIAKHAEASRVTVQLENANGAFRMTIQDNGKILGELERATGHGVRNMKMRAARLGGDLEIRRNGGCTVNLTAPALR